MNELTALCEKYQNGIADATVDLHKKTRMSNALNMEYEEVDQSMAALQQQLRQTEIDARTRGQSIEHLQDKFASTLRIGKKSDVGHVDYDLDKENFDELNEKGEPMRPGHSFFDKPILPQMKCRSVNAILRAESEIEAIDRKIRIIEEQRLHHQVEKARRKRDELYLRKRELEK